MTARKKSRTARIVPIDAERVGPMYRGKKITPTMSMKIAHEMLMERGKRVIYRTPNGMYWVMK